MVSTPGGRKDDQAKSRYDLISPLALEQLARVLTYGAAKYNDRNWEKGIAYSRVFAAIMRHLWAWMRGEDTDPESKLPHLAHAMCGCHFLLHFVESKRTGLDDRPATQISCSLVNA